MALPGADAEARLERIAPGYAALVRRAAGRIGLRDPAVDDVDAALDELTDAATIDVDVPIVSARRTVRLVKAAVKPLVGWYLRYVGQQVTALGESTSRLGRALVLRGNAVEARADALARVVDGLAARVERLEQQAHGGEVGGDVADISVSGSEGAAP